MSLFYNQFCGIRLFCFRRFIHVSIDKIIYLWTSSVQTLCTHLPLQYSQTATRYHNFSLGFNWTYWSLYIKAYLDKGWCCRTVVGRENPGSPCHHGGQAHSLCVWSGFLLHMSHCNPPSHSMSPSMHQLIDNKLAEVIGREWKHTAHHDSVTG